MKSEIDKKRSQFRESIRKNHLENKFKQIRHLMKDIVHEDILKQINHHLATFKEFYTRKENAFELLECLTELHKISEQYKIIVLLCRLAHNEEVTWLEMLCIMMKEQWSETLREQCSYLLSNCVEQLKYMLEASMCDQIYFDQLKSLMEKYPYVLIKEGTPRTIQNSLKIVYYMSLSGNKGTSLYFLLNKTTPPLLKVLHILYNNKPMMLIERVREAYIITTVSLAFLAHVYHFQTHQSEYYQKLKNNLNTLVEDRLHKSNSKEEFSTHFEYLRIMARIEMYVPSPEQFQKLEDYLPRELHEQNEAYFKMMQTITCVTLQKLSVESTRRVIQCIFQVDSYIDLNRLTFRISLLRLIKDHINNCSNRIRDQDVLSFLELWGTNNTNASHLIDLAQAINLQKPLQLAVLFQIIGYILVWADEPMELIEASLFPLLKYPHYRIRLQQLGYQLQGEDEL